MFYHQGVKLRGTPCSINHILPFIHIHMLAWEQSEINGSFETKHSLIKKAQEVIKQSVIHFLWEVSQKSSLINL